MEAATAALTLTEAMIAEVTGSLLPTTLLVRRLTASGGPVEALVDFDPRLGEHHRPPRVEHRGEVTVCSWDDTASRSSAARRIGSNPDSRRRSPSHRVQPLTVTLGVAERAPLSYVYPDIGWAALEADERRWRAWGDDIDHTLPHREMTVRSLLTLRLLTYSPSGAPVAAPTTSLPGASGRHPQLGLSVRLAPRRQHRRRRLPRHRQADEARRFLAWLLHASRLARPRLPVLLTLHGRHPAAERELRGWPGYAAADRCGSATAPRTNISSMVTAGSSTPPGCSWRPGTGSTPRHGGRCEASPTKWPGAGRSPTRGSGRSAANRAHHVHSKLMAWLALDRALRIAVTHRTPARQSARWDRARRHRCGRHDPWLRRSTRQLHPHVRLDRPRRGPPRAPAARDRTQ